MWPSGGKGDNFCSGCMLKGLSLGTYVLGFGLEGPGLSLEGRNPGLGLEILALNTSLIKLT